MRHGEWGGYRFDRGLAMEWGEKALLVIAILIITWIVAKLAKWGFAKLVEKVDFLKRDTGSGDSIGYSLGKIISLLVWLFGLVVILDVLSLGNVTSPVQGLLTDVLHFIPNLIGAGLIFFIGAIIAKIVRDLVETVLTTVDFDKWLGRTGATEVTGNPKLSKTIATIVYVLIMIPVVIAALQALQITAISGPLVGMLERILDAIPNIIGAALLLALGYVIGKWVAGLIEQILPGLGVDRTIGAIGVLPAGTSASKVIGKIVLIAIVLISAVAATRLLGFPELTILVAQVVELGGQVIFGGVIIAVGFMLANILANLMSGTGAATIVKYATIFLFAFIGLRQMGIGEEIVDMAFGAIVIGTAVAGALAFGLGGREWAGRKLEEIDRKAPPPPPSGTGTPGSTTPPL